jgi:CubicO group peptidase (beta-lactamase class C family)
MAGGMTDNREGIGGHAVAPIVRTSRKGVESGRVQGNVCVHNILLDTTWGEIMTRNHVSRRSLLRSAAAAALAQLPAHVQDYLDQTGLPGLAIGVVYQDEVRYLEGFGVREVGSGTPIDADTVFQIASVSKPVSSTIVSGVVGDGIVTWDTKIADIDPSFALRDPWVTANVTLADLFSHRSGLPDHAGDLLEDLGATREQVLHRLRYLEPEGAFRASYAYTNFGLTAAAVAVARAAETVWEDLADATLFGPLGMTRSSYRYSDFTARENRCVGHVRQDGAWFHAFDRQPDAQSPAGGVSSTVRDMSQWMRLQLNNGAIDGEQVIDGAALDTTHVPHAISRATDNPAAEFPGFYGLGWNVGRSPSGDISWGPSGAFAYGAATAVYLWPGEQLGIAVLTNGEPMGLPEAISVGFHDLCHTGSVQNDYLAIFQPIIEADLIPDYGAGVADSPASVEPASANDAYTGSFDNDFFGDLEVVEDGPKLAMRLGPNRDSFPLTHYSRDVFTYQPVGENAGRASAVTFTIAADGKASRVVIENLNVYKAGTFVRA